MRCAHCAVCTRTGTVHEKCRGGVHAVQSRNIGDFLGPSQSSIRPIQPFSGQFWRLPLFPPTQSRIEPLRPFLRPTLSFCPLRPSQVIFASTARAQSQSRPGWAEKFLGEQLKLCSSEFSPAGTFVSLASFAAQLFDIILHSIYFWIFVLKLPAF